MAPIVMCGFEIESVQNGARVKLELTNGQEVVFYTTKQDGKAFATMLELTCESAPSVTVEPINVQYSAGT